jgi:Xaa-Pro aminopeptidase
VAINALRPGVACNAVFQLISNTAQEAGIDFCAEPGAGHGVGVSEREAPYLVLDDETILQAGMVLVLAVYTFGPQRELICSKDTYEITETGSRLLSWYKNWDKLYTVIGDTARHG